MRLGQSHDGGATWDIRTIAAASKPVMRAQTLASGVERLLLAYATSGGQSVGEEQTELTWSDDGGASWAPALIIDTPQGQGSPRPQVTGSAGDGAWVTFFDIAGAGNAQHSRYLVVKVVNGVAGAPLVLDEIDLGPERFGDYMGLASSPDGDAFAAWVTSRGGAFDIVWARITGGDEPIAQVRPAKVWPKGLDEPVEYEFTGHVNFPGCHAEPDPALDAAVRDRVEFEFEVPADTRFVNASLDWEMQQPVADLDLYLYDAQGDLWTGDDRVPERFSGEIEEGDQGPWTALVQNCENAPTDFTLEIVLS